MQFRKYSIAVAAAAVAVLALTLSAASANDSGDPAYMYASDPQTTNIPYVAWNGSQIRLAKCLTPSELRSAIEESGQDYSSLDKYVGEFEFEAWSGTNTSLVNSPFFDNGDGARTAVDVEGRTEQYKGEATTLDLNGAPAPGPQSYRLGAEPERLCFAANVISGNPGLGVIKLSIRKGFLGNSDGKQPFLKHVFLAIWMTPSISLAEVATGDPKNGTETQFTGGSFDGDPDGSGTYKPNPLGDQSSGNYTWENGLVKITATGTFPHGDLSTQSALLPVGGPAIVTLPRDWPVLAEKWSHDKWNPVYGSAVARWDIHDDTTNFALHNSNACSPNTPNRDAVDNCTTIGNPGQLFGDFGPFSRYAVNHSAGGIEVAFPAVGPFDPLRPNTSYLADGVTNAGDAPMPALPVEASLAASGAYPMIGGLVEADKSVLFSRNNAGSNTLHNLYAPFYKAYIPAAPGPEDAAIGDFGRSGVASTNLNNSTSFNVGLYDFWEFWKSTSYNNSGANKCKNPSGDTYLGPQGVKQALVFTDEHGEAYIGFNPVFRFDTEKGAFVLPHTPALPTSSINVKCDLEPGIAGKVNIKARAFYPEQPAVAIAAPETLTKTVLHEASKVLTCQKKVGTLGSTCTETITDLAGNPVEGAHVLFNITNNAGGTIQADTTAESYLDLKGLHVYTDSDGKATIYVRNSDNLCVDINAENVGTRYLNNPNEGGVSVGVERDMKVRPSTGTSPCTSTSNNEGGSNQGGSNQGGSNQGGSNQGGSNQGGSNQGGSNQGGSAAAASVTVSLGGPIVKAGPVLVATTKPTLTVAASKLVTLKMLQSSAGRFLFVNVKSSAKTAKLRIAIMGKNGKVLRTVVRTVPTNRPFKIANLKLGKTAVAVRASVLVA